jgi:hypothetical protein
VFPRSNAAQMGKSGNEADGPVPAHAKVADIVEKYHARDAGWVGRFEEGRADDHIGAARLVYDGGTERVMLVAKNFQSVRDAAAAEIGSATDDNASRFATGVRVYDGDAPHWENEE